MTHDDHEPQPPVSPWVLPAIATRHDGWTGEKMAIFCETLAETGLVVDACLAAGKSTNTAYSLRRRNPLFAAAWESALTIARKRLADTLLARSIEGVTEQYYKDGELVGERKVIDNRLALAILRRLDRMAEGMFPGAGRGPGAAKQRSDAAFPTQAIDWDLALSALRTCEEGAVAEALAMFKSYETHEAHDPPNSLIEEEQDEGLDLSERCWRDPIDEDLWMTDFPPPAGFDGYESRPYDDIDDDEPYQRACTEEEVAILEADEAAERAAERAEDEALRDAWFALLKSELTSHCHPGLEPGSAFTSAAEEGSPSPQQGRARSDCNDE